jgi:DNA-binding NtrC family response regulator
MAAKSRPLVLIADDNEEIVHMLEYQLQSWGYRTSAALNNSQLLQRFSQEEPDLILLDLKFGEHDGIMVMRDLLRASPNLTVVLLTGHGTIDSAVEAIRQGAYDYLTKPPDIQRLRLTLGHGLEKRDLSRRVEQLRRLAEPQDATSRIWGNSPALNRLRELIASVAPTDVTVLIQGESGTGKELVARALHDQSRRRQGPYVPVNMAALPRELVESTLFGHEKGAFTGADQVRIGCCEAADGGSLFLDEIGEMDLNVQAKLLRFLQEREIQRVGSSRVRSVDVRIVAATNRDLRDQVGRGLFREDLYYRLQVVPVEVPPLRARRDDIPLLASRFLERAAVRHGKDVAGFTPDALAVLTRHDWPGNIRQLENLVERLVILCRGREIDLDDLPPEIRDLKVLDSPLMPGGSDLEVHLIEEVEKQAILGAIRKTLGNVRNAAKLLGLGQATVYRKIKRYGIHLRGYSHSVEETPDLAASSGG